MDVILCCNCDNATASFSCQMCLPSESSFCSDCMDLHSKIKLYKGHSFQKLVIQNYIVCKNCEKSQSKFVCRNCDNSNKFMCLGCSLMHPQIKAFRGHTVVTLNSGSESDFKMDSVNWTSFGTFFDSLNSCVLYITEIGYANIAHKTWTDFLFWRTILLALLLSLFYYLLIRAIFRDYSTLVNIAMGICVYKWLMYNKGKSSEINLSKPNAVVAAQKASLIWNSNENNFNISKRPQINTISDISGNSDFKDEFWYSTEVKRASMRPRTRPYKGRTTNNCGSGNSSNANSPDRVKKKAQDLLAMLGGKSNNNHHQNEE